MTNEEKTIAESNKKYFWAEVPIEIVEGQKEYDITAIALYSEMVV